MASERPVRELASYLAPENKRPAWGILGLKTITAPGEPSPGAVRECCKMVAIILQKGIYFFSLSATPFFFRRRACRKFACAVLFREE
jgi:hypothetical protein